MGCGQPSCPQPPLRLWGRTGVLRRREGYFLACFPRHPLLLWQVVLCLCLRGASSCRGALPAGPASCGSAFPSFSSSRSCFFFFHSRGGGYVFLGSRTSFQAAVVERSVYRFSYAFALPYGYCVYEHFRGGRTCSPDWGLCTSSLSASAKAAHVLSFLWHESQGVFPLFVSCNQSCNLLNTGDSVGGFKCSNSTKSTVGQGPPLNSRSTCCKPAVSRGGRRKEVLSEV